MARPAQSETDVEFAGNAPHNTSRNAKQTHLAVLLVKKETILLLREFLRTTASPDDHAKPAPFIHRQRTGIDACTLERLICGTECKWQDARNVFAVLLFDPGKLVKIRYFAGNLHIDLRSIES